MGVRQRRAEDVGVPAFEPGRGIGDQRKRGCVAFRKSVTAEAFELLEGLFGKFAFIAVVDHSVDQLVAEMGDAAGELEGRHRLAQHVRSEEHTSELQSLMRISYAVFCL